MQIRTLALYGLMAAALAGCSGAGGVPTPDPNLNARDKEFLSLAPRAEIGSEYQRYVVDDPTGAQAGTITIDSDKNFLYYSMPNHKAIRYGVATGSEAAGWKGEAHIGKLAEWPGWMPPADMLERWPHLRPTAEAGGLPGGPDNPLARAPCISTRAARTRFTASTAPTSRTRSATMCRRAASACAIWTPSTSTTACKIGTKVVVL